MQNLKINFVADHEKLVGEAILGGAGAPQLFFLHGAGQAHKDRAKPLAERIVNESGQGAFLFDFSGHGESSGELKQSSLKKRVSEANAAWQFLTQDNPIAVFAFSMGGHIALELLAHHEIENLILFYPGIYTEKAFELPFDERFSNAIRQKNSWQNAAVLDNLQKFTGNLLIVWGENDTVVPRGVVDTIYDSAQNAHSRELFVVPNGEHLLLPQLYSNEPLMGEVAGKIAKAMALAR